MSGARERQKRLASYLAEKGVFALVLEDFENLRSRSIRYLCGHPMDAILFLFADGKAVLVPWDVNMARARAEVDGIIPYTDFHRSFKEAVATVLRENGLEGAGSGRRIEISGRTPYTRHRDLRDALEGTEIVCDDSGSDLFLSKMRTIKDSGELDVIRRSAKITNALISGVEGLIGKDGLNEISLAHFVEREAMARGAEGMGFETLAAGPSRSWGIHAFPPYSNGPFGGRGFSILDFGVTVDGYTSDVTLTVARGPLAGGQKRMLDLVQRAFEEAVAASAPGSSPREPARRVDDLFASEGWKMPHALGHGIGLDAHEGPLLRSQGEPSDPALVPGMVFTIEPGLYHPEYGGVRLENDLLMTEEGAEVLTTSKIIMLD